jgi:uncharacterized beta-barrel protein YwiB (DUF1934 family)
MTGLEMPFLVPHDSDQILIRSSEIATMRHATRDNTKHSETTPQATERERVSGDIQYSVDELDESSSLILQYHFQLASDDCSRLYTIRVTSKPQRSNCPSWTV